MNKRFVSTLAVVLVLLSIACFATPASAIKKNPSVGESIANLWSDLSNAVRHRIGGAKEEKHTMQQSNEWTSPDTLHRQIQDQVREQQSAHAAMIRKALASSSMVDTEAGSTSAQVAARPSMFDGLTLLFEQRAGSPPSISKSRFGGFISDDDDDKESQAPDLMLLLNSMVPESQWVPPVDISETEDEIRFDIELPGVAKHDIELSVKENILSISGSTECPMKALMKEAAKEESTTDRPQNNADDSIMDVKPVPVDAMVDIEPKVEVMPPAPAPEADTTTLLTLETRDKGEYDPNAPTPPPQHPGPVMQSGVMTPEGQWIPNGFGLAIPHGPRVDHDEMPVATRSVMAERKWLRMERPRGKFERRFMLPIECVGETPTAELVNGVLTVIVPKHAAVSQTIQIGDQ